MSRLFIIIRLLTVNYVMGELYGKENHSCWNCQFIIRDCNKYTACGYLI